MVHASSVTIAGDTDPIETALKECQADTHRLRSQLDKGDANAPLGLYLTTWRQRFLALAEKHPDSPFRRDALSRALGMSNSLEDYQTSERIGQKLFDISTTTAGRLNALGELGEVTRLLFQRSKNANDMERSLNYFQQYETACQNESTKLTPDLRERRMMYRFYVADGIDRIGGSHLEALRALQLGFQLAKTLDIPDEKRLSLEFAPESFARRRLKIAGRIGDIDAVLSSLKDLETLPVQQLKRPLSLFVREVGEIMFPQRGAKFRSFLMGWLDEHPADRGTGILLTEVGADLVSSRAFCEAITPLESARRQHLGSMRGLEPEAEKRGRGGYISKMLYNLARAYQECGQLDKSHSVIQQAIALRPNDELLKTLAPLQLKYDAGKQKAEAQAREAKAFVEPPARSPYLAYIVGLNVVLAGAIITRAVWIRRRRTQR